MIPLRVLKPIPPAEVTGERIAAAGGRWWPVASALGTLGWRLPAGWRPVRRSALAALPDAALLAAAADPATGAAAELRHFALPWPVHAGDFVDLGDPRPFDSGCLVRRGGVVVAERLGRQDGRSLAAAAHGLGRHVVLVRASGPEAQADTLRLACAAVIGPAAAGDDERVRTCRELPLRLRVARDATLVEHDGFVRVATALGAAASEALLHVEPTGDTPDEVITRVLGRVAPSDSALRARRVRLQRASLGLSGAAVLAVAPAEEGDEIVAYAAELGPERRLVALARHCGRERNPLAWLGARYALGKLLAGLEPAR
jgi:hypothetical protein